MIKLIEVCKISKLSKFEAKHNVMCLLNRKSSLTFDNLFNKIENL